VELLLEAGDEPLQVLLRPFEHEGLPHLVENEGASLVPVFSGRTLPPRAVFFEHEGNRAVRLGRWKLVSRAEKDAFAWWRQEDPGPGNWELYDMEADRTETKDLGSERPDLVLALAEMWHQWVRRTHVLPYPE